LTADFRSEVNQQTGTRELTDLNSEANQQTGARELTTDLISERSVVNCLVPGCCLAYDLRYVGNSLAPVCRLTSDL
jgi:hypothetical protein